MNVEEIIQRLRTHPDPTSGRFLLPSPVRHPVDAALSPQQKFRLRDGLLFDGNNRLWSEEEFAQALREAGLLPASKEPAHQKAAADDQDSPARVPERKTSEAEAGNSLTPTQKKLPVVAGIAGSAQQPLDFIDTYVKYADVLEAPPEMHEAVAIQLLASVLNKNGVTIPLGAVTQTLDLWYLILSGSGFGRSTVVRMANQVLAAANMSDLVRTTTWGSPQAMYQEFAQHPSGLFVWGEISEYLKQLKDLRFGGAKQWLTDRYDNSAIPASITYRNTGSQEQNTPPIVFGSVPRINILATSSYSWFFDSVVKEDSSGGFVPRWFQLHAPDAGRVVPVPTAPDPSLVPALSHHLMRVDQLRGPADISLIQQDYGTWYRATQARFKAQSDKALAEAYFNRHRGHVLKLAVAYEASSSASLRVTLTSWQRAVKTVLGAENTISRWIPTGMSASGYLADQMTEAVRAAGAQGLPLGRFTRDFQREDRERNQKLNTLVQADIVSCFRRQTKGRAATTLVHADFIAEYRAGHPEETEVSSPHFR